jgi:transposase
MKKHMVSAHIIVPESERTCSTCGKISPNKKAMLNHIRTVHVDRIFDCSVCDKSFKRATNLKVRFFEFIVEPD